MFKPIDNGHVSLPEKIAEQVKSKIMTGKIKPGDKLPSESELCVMFNVSRTPIREAVKILSSQGFVKIKRGIGIYVEDMSCANLTSSLPPIHIDKQEDFNDVMRVRKLLEVNACVWACQNATSKDIQQMEDVVRESELALSIGAGREDLDLMNSFFHTLVAKSSGSKALIQIMNPFWSLISDSRKITLMQPERKTKSVEGHREILEAIKKRDTGAAEAAMMRHLEGVGSSVGTSKAI